MKTEDFFSTILKISSPSAIRRLVRASEKKPVRRGELIIREGEIQKNLLFLMQGILRGYFIDVYGNDITDCFNFKPGHAVMSAFEIGGSSMLFIEALTSGEVLRIPVELVKELLEEGTEFVWIYNYMLRGALQDIWELKTMLQKCSAQERYQWFLKNYPGLIDQVTNKYIASFLRMSPVTLSRLKTGLEKEQHDGK